jgi:hypothetical protein
MTPAEKDWQTGMQPHSHKKHKSIVLCVGGEEGGKQKNKQEK